MCKRANKPESGEAGSVSPLVDDQAQQLHARVSSPEHESDADFLLRLEKLGQDWRYSGEFIGIVVRAHHVHEIRETDVPDIRAFLEWAHRWADSDPQLAALARLEARIAELTEQLAVANDLDEKHLADALRLEGALREIMEHGLGLRDPSLESVRSIARAALAEAEEPYADVPGAGQRGC